MALDPLHQFQIQPIIPIEVAGIDLSFSNASLFMVLGAVLTVAFMSIGLSRRALIPGRWQSASESIYEFIANMLREQTGAKGREFFPFVFTLFMVVLMGNLLGMIPYSFTYTSHIIVTFTLAIVVFLLVTILGFVKHGLHFLSFFAPSGIPLPLLFLVVPIELVAYLSRPISLSVRLFANMMAGHMILKVFAGFAVMMGIAGVLPLILITLLTGFEFLIAFIQAYVFAVLTCVYLKDALELH
ncbi:MAG TPA: F0F1 ATP synthase subunit A [Rhodospirillaceae bacterium]|nr:F0F1 ATP synthase subunit A [Alphaproteobacteria bacterium]OUT39274.1 MAG: F0F1 ATP synthase subunit A [Micavibrio sp. TMED2]HCI47656.1 F0F1 ATP synthase subunit A [Rhodospirillaceae bacterium]MAS48627.1 F0F1 ATP synthase subunit A [Alphaproteobacteria bacterium]MAX96114.1 F0F1 ATP synthase subunit A [Alphaproteobacteria bacterium]